MMDLNNWLFLISFLFITGVTIYKVYLLMREVFIVDVERQNLVFSWMIFISNLFAWVICLVITMLDTSILTYSVLLNVANFMLGINVLLLIVSHLLAMKVIGRDQKVTYSRGNSFLRRL